VHARICSLLEKGNFSLDNKFDASLLTEETEVDIIRSLYNYNQVVKDAAEKYEPYFITRYVVELAKKFKQILQPNTNFSRR
jgi:arginyl-tRNA synthetase